MATIAEMLVKIGADTSDLHKKMEGVGQKVKGVGDKMKGIGQSISMGVTAPIVGGLVAVTKGTEEFREDLARLDTNAQTAGVSASFMKDKLAELNGVTGEADSNVEALSNLLQSGFDEQGMTSALDALSGAVIKFPDTLKIEGLADGLQETLATGKAIGPFAELLERMGVDVDTFNDGLAVANKYGNEQNYVLQTLAKTGLAEVNDQYRKNNEELVKSKEGSAKFQQATAELGETLGPIMTNITEAITGVIEKFNNLSPTTQNIIIVMAGLAAAVGPVLLVVATLTTIFSGLIPIAGALGIGVGALVGIIAGVIVAIVALVAAGILIRKNWDTIKAKTAEIWGAIKSFLASTWEWIKSKGAQVFQAIKDKVSQIWDSVKAKTSDIWNGIKSFLSNIVSSIKTAVSDKFNAMKDAIRDKMEAAKTAIENVWNKVEGFFKGISLKQIGKDIIQGLIDGISSMFGTIKKWVGKAADLIPSWLKKKLGIKSPSRVTMALGQYTGEGLAVGMANSLGMIEGMSNKMATSAVPNVKAGHFKSNMRRDNGIRQAQQMQAPSHAVINIGGYEAKGVISYISEEQQRSMNRSDRFRG